MPKIGGASCVIQQKKPCRPAQIGKCDTEDSAAYNGKYEGKEATMAVVQKQYSFTAFFFFLLLPLLLPPSNPSFPILYSILLSA